MNFEEQYFEEIYNAEYDRRNPAYKFRSYFSELKPFAARAGRLLDIGCAYGSFLKEVNGHYEVFGSDISKHAVSVAKERVPAASCFVSDVLNLPEDRTFEVITCFDIIEHVPEIESAIGKIRKLLAPAGLWVVSVPVYDTIVGKLVGKLDRDPTHVHKNSRYWWLRLVRENGFEIVAWKGIWRYYFKGLFYLHYVSRMTRTFSPAILLICRPKR